MSDLKRIKIVHTYETVYDFDKIDHHLDNDRRPHWQVAVDLFENEIEEGTVKPRATQAHIFQIVQ